MVLYLAVGMGIAILGGAVQATRRRADAETDEAVR